MIRIALRHLYRNLEQYFRAFLMARMVFCLGPQVFFRFVLNASLTWSEELSRFAFIWRVCMGAVLGAKERVHLRVTAFHRLLPVVARGWVLPAADLLWVVINLTFAGAPRAAIRGGVWRRHPPGQPRTWHTRPRSSRMVRMPEQHKR